MLTRIIQIKNFLNFNIKRLFKICEVQYADVTLSQPLWGLVGKRLCRRVYIRRLRRVPKKGRLSLTNNLVSNVLGKTIKINFITHGLTVK